MNEHNDVATNSEIADEREDPKHLIERKAHNLRKMSVALIFMLLMMHLLLLTLFAIIGVWPMVFVNVASILCYSVLAALLTSSTMPLAAANSVAMGEILIQMTAAIAYVGWNTGFSLYCIALVCIVFFWSRASEKYGRPFHHPLIISICTMALYFVLGYIAGKVQPLYEVPLFWLKFLYITNSAITFVVTIAFAKVYSDAIESSERAYRAEANIDELTMLYNRRKVRDILGEAHAVAAKGGVPYSVAMIDIDNFKSVNDKWGHNMGDYALASVANILFTHTSPTAKACRWGGDEFLLIDASADDLSIGTIEAFRAHVEKTEFRHNGTSFRLSVTAGVASFKAGCTISDVIARADAALYKGKTAGKNTVVFD